MASFLGSQNTLAMLMVGREGRDIISEKQIELMLEERDEIQQGRGGEGLL